MAPETGESVTPLEEGYLYAFWRPVVEEEDPESQRDVQRFYLVLSPSGERSYRLLVVGGKELPDPKRPGRSRRWAFVQAQAENPKRILDELGAERYQTKTRGERHQPAARPAGQGVYQLVRHGDHTHLAYALERPEELGDVQEELNIEPEASYILALRNPDAPAPPQAGLPRHERADLPAEIAKQFRGRKFGDVDPSTVLDYVGSEVLLIAASDDAQAELGLDLDVDTETTRTDAIFRDLRLRKTQQPIAPLYEGRWE